MSQRAGKEVHYICESSNPLEMKCNMQLVETTAKRAKLEQAHRKGNYVWRQLFVHIKIRHPGKIEPNKKKRHTQTMACSEQRDFTVSDPDRWVMAGSNASWGTREQNAACF